ncbi:MAG: hypothetical protein C4560_07680 [Nitrospiraceae bacterium]|nr:MAG: hypothetical protein C4560_07680 [Nitrospiraceae bacterium]
MQYENGEIEMKYAFRFGRIAIDKGFVNNEQLQEALTEQVSNNPLARLRPHKLIGEILFEKGWMSLKQIEVVLAEMFKDKAAER